MKPGTRVAGRWEVVESLPARGELSRWRVRDGDTEAEVVAPPAHVLLRAGVREAFSAVKAVDHPAALPILATSIVDGVPVRVQPLTAELGRLTPAEAVAVAGWLAPAILAGNGLGGGELRPADLVLDAEGVPRFAPTGIPAAGGVAHIPFHRAPEGRADGPADLFGLGVVLYRAVTGEEPFSARTPSELRQDVLPAVAGLDDILGLLAVDPAARVRAVEGLPCEPIHLRVPTPPALPAKVATTAPVPSAPAPLPPYAVVVSLKGLSDAALRVVASRSAADLAAVRRAAARGADWAVALTPTEAEANRVVRRLDVAGVRARVGATNAPKVIQYLLLAMVAAVVGLISGFWAVFFIVAGVLTWLGLANLRAMWTVAQTRFSAQERDRAALPDDSPEARMRALRGRIAMADIADAVATDLRERISRAEEALDAHRTHEAELAGTGGGDAELRARAARLTAELAAVRAEVDAVEGALARVLTEDLAEAPKRVIPAVRPMDTQ